MPTEEEQRMNEEEPVINEEDDVPAEVPDFVDPDTAVIESTPLDEDTSAAADPGALAELRDLVGEL